MSSLWLSAIALTLTSLLGCSPPPNSQSPSTQSPNSPSPAPEQAPPPSSTQTSSTTAPTPVPPGPSRLNELASTADNTVADNTVADNSTESETSIAAPTDATNADIPAIAVNASPSSRSNLTTAQLAADQSGVFRVGNQTESPLRVALLAQGAAQTTPTQGTETSPAPERSNKTSSRDRPNPNDPFHWDFAPGEGGRDGLLLALPQGDLSLVHGDIVVAFAQDGSRQYWGPYLVGKTSLPYWDGDRQEWQLLIQP